MRTRILSALLVALVSMPGALSAQASDVKLDEVMSTQDQMATGVANLSAAQRQSLERWLARYTGTVAAVARRIDRLPARETEAPRADLAPRSEPARQAARRPAAAAFHRNGRGGGAPHRSPARARDRVPARRSRAAVGAGSSGTAPPGAGAEPNGQAVAAAQAAEWRADAAVDGRLDVRDAGGRNDVGGLSPAPATGRHVAPG